ncbi:hypothetical protein GGI15_004392 [Coemansia interrupta]|uniref:Methionine synthase reductase n=1 Tax=Coemansia interrupta TaxID=1126814 RepID=A0A9W8LG46_9FUNG|nr:hypothetical protein GGI15_004392 [Coemansia interrupta]
MGADTDAKHVAFLYASQTGNAETISHQLYASSVHHGHASSCHALDTYPASALPTLHTAVFIVSTTGDGDPPDNALKFWRTLRRTLKNKDKPLGNLRYALLGLGDTNYSNFCNTAVRLDAMLEEAGARRFYEKGLADDATGLEDVVEPWIEGLWPALNEAVGGKAADEQVEGGEAEAEAEAEADAEDVDGAVAAAVEALSVAQTQPVHQRLVVDYGALAQLQKLSGAPKSPPSICALTPAPAAASDSSSSSSQTLPPWHAALCAEHPDALHQPFVARLGAARRLTADAAAKRTLLLTIEPPAAEHAACRAGDAINVYAPNNGDLVSALLERLGVAADQPVLLAAQDERIALPPHLQRFSSAAHTLRQILLWAVDLTSPVRKQTLRALAECCADAGDRDRLLFLCSRQGAAQFDGVRRQAAHIVDLLHAFPSCHVGAARLLDLLAPLQPRAYSVCSVEAGRWQVAFNVAEYELEIADPFAAAEETAAAVVVRRRGVCTPWLERLATRAASADVLVARRPGHFHLADGEGRPVVMVGPGTGVAPFIGFLEQRAREKQAGTPTGPAWLFFGCRSPSLDHLFDAQLSSWLAQGVLSRLTLCFSRDEDARRQTGAQRYVQDAVRANAEELGRLLVEQHAVVYVCGDARGMGPDVNQALADVLCEYVAAHPKARAGLGVEERGGEEVGLSRAEALQVLVRWAAEKRYLRDLWA